MSKKLLKGKDIQKTDIGAAAKEMQNNIDNMDMDNYDDEGNNDAPVFTPELAALMEKEKNGGKKKTKKT
jgi:periodic tryptophan protein 1